MIPYNDDYNEFNRQIDFVLNRFSLRAPWQHLLHQ